METADRAAADGGLRPVLRGPQLAAPTALEREHVARSSPRIAGSSHGENGVIQPPSTIASGSSTLTIDASAIPSAAPASASAASARASLASARASSSAAARSAGSASPARLITTALPATVSRQPRAPQAQRRPPGSTVTCPSSPPNP